MNDTPRVLVVDERQPLFPHWLHVDTFEEAFEVLNDTAVDELWLSHDFLSKYGDSLVDVLLTEAPYEGPKFRRLMIAVSDAYAEETEIERQLKNLDGVTVIRVVSTPELFGVSVG